MSGSVAREEAALADALHMACSRIGDGRIAQVRRLSAGASQEIWSFDLMTATSRHPLILRRAPAGLRADSETNTLDMEAALLRHVAPHGVPVPAVRLVLAPDDSLGEGYLMDRVEGETLPPRIMRQPEFAPARAAFPEQAGVILANIHRVPCDDLALPTRSPTELIALTEARYRARDMPRPVFDLALRWLEDNLPPAVTPRLVHGDFRNGNLMFGPEGIRAVLDWELAHKGDPLEDLGWLTVPSWRFGAIDLPAGGLGRLEPLLEAYESQTGPVDRAALRFWQVYGTLRWGAMCAAMTKWVEDGTDPTPERAMIARRGSETELDLLDLLREREARDA